VLNLLPANTSVSSILGYLESVLGMTSSRKWKSELMKSLLYSEHLQVTLILVFCGILWNLFTFLKGLWGHQWCKLTLLFPVFCDICYNVIGMSLAIMVRMSQDNHFSVTLFFSWCNTSHYTFMAFRQLPVWVWLTGGVANRGCGSFNHR